MTTNEVKSYTRPGEVLVKVTLADAGTCVYSGKPLMEGRFAWAEAPEGWDCQPGNYGKSYKPEENWFPSYRHVDGSERCGSGPTGWGWCWPKPTCLGCGAEDQLTTVQEAYGNRTTCGACGRETYYDIGD
jgi:hypothetical protein